MSVRIFKYPLVVTDDQTVGIPGGSRILSVDNQNGVLTLWAMVNTDRPVEPRHIRIVGTGHEIADKAAASLEFIGTVLMDPFVWHVFEWRKI